MRQKYQLIIALLLFSTFLGCGNSGDQVLNSELIISEKTHPHNFYDEADQGVLAKLVDGQDAYLYLWEEFGFTEKPVEIDWDHQAVIFLGLIESGTCPYSFDSVELNVEKTDLIFHLKTDSKQRACTDDATPRAMVISVDAENINDVKFVQVRNYSGLQPRVMLMYVNSSAN